LPLLAVPELKMSKPLTPLVPAFAVRMLSEPLVVDDPEPLAMLTEPPVMTLLVPAYAPS